MPEKLRGLQFRDLQAGSSLYSDAAVMGLFEVV